MKRENPERKKSSSGRWNRVVAAVLLVAGILIARGKTEANQPVLNPPDFEDVSAFTAENVDQIDRWLQKRVETASYPSLSVAIVREDEIIYQNAFGFADLETGTAATTETAYHVASVTKAFTATMAAVLHEQGVIDLDEPVLKYLPKGVSISTTPEIGNTITFRQLAAQMSGLPRGVSKPVQSIDDRYQLEPNRLYEVLAKAKLEFEPGTNDRYSNLGYGLLGHALELASGQSFEQLLQELICEPLDLKHSTVDVDQAPNLATGYSDELPRKPEGYSRERRLVGSGGLITSAPDLARFLLAHMKPGEAFSAETISEMRKRVRLKDGSPISRTLGWSIHRGPSSGVILQKNGGRNNCKAWFGFSPRHEIGVVVVSNCGDDSVDLIGFQLLERSIPGGCKLMSEQAVAKVSPWTGFRWEDGNPTVQVQGEWAPLKSIDGIQIQKIMEFSKKNYRDEAQARMRIAEDLVEVLVAMGHQPTWDVELGLDQGNGKVEAVSVRMTEENRIVLRD